MTDRFRSRGVLSDPGPGASVRRLHPPHDGICVLCLRGSHIDIRHNNRTHTHTYTHTHEWGSRDTYELTPHTQCPSLSSHFRIKKDTLTVCLYLQWEFVNPTLTHRDTPQIFRTRKYFGFSLRRRNSELWNLFQEKYPQAQIFTPFSSLPFPRPNLNDLPKFSFQKFYHDVPSPRRYHHEGCALA